MRLPVLLAAGSLLLVAGCLNEFQEPTEPHHVMVSKLELSPARVLSQDVVLNVTTILDNRGGGESGHVRLTVKAFSENTGFLLTENATTVGVLPGDTTRPVSVGVVVPREGSIRVEVTLYEDDLARPPAFISARNLQALEPEVLDTGLRISDLDFIVRGVVPGPGAGPNATGNRSGGRATIQADLYVTNEGRGPSEDLRVQVKAREVSTRLVSDVAWTDTGVIQPGTTVIRSVNVTVPDGYNYVFEILTWRGDVIVARSEGIVQLAPTFQRPKDQEVVAGDPNLLDFVTSPYPPTTAPTPASEWNRGHPGGGGLAGDGVPAPEVPGFGAGLLVAALVAAATILAARRRRQSP